MNEWDCVSSIWEGWTDQCLDALFTVRFGDSPCVSYCAIGYLSRNHITLDGNYTLEDAETERRFLAVDRELWNRYGHLTDDAYEEGMGIVYANDYADWTPDDFRDLDRRLEYEYRMNQIKAQVDAVPEEVCA